MKKSVVDTRGVWSFLEHVEAQVGDPKKAAEMIAGFVNPIDVVWYAADVFGIEIVPDKFSIAELNWLADMLDEHPGLKKKVKRIVHGKMGLDKGELRCSGTDEEAFKSGLREILKESGNG